MSARSLALAGCIALALAGCAQIDYDALPAARFEGTLHVVWVGEGQHSAGDGLFVYVPDPRNPLRLVRENPDATVEVIEPSMIYTDGGSIPRPATLFQGFSPWGYGPAYIIHDWLFVARQCLNDGNTDPVYAPYAEMPFRESAEIIAEAIKALIEAGRVAPNQVAPRVISGTVSGPVSYERWVAEGECNETRIPDDIRARALLGTPGAPVPRAAILALGVEEAIVVQETPGQTVASFSF